MFRFIRRELRGTDWKHFFRKNGVGAIAWKKINWTHNANDIDCLVTVHGEIIGGFRGYGGSGIFMAKMSDNGHAELRPTSQNFAEHYFESYALPDCRCRLGRHWKCGIHGSCIG